MNRKGMFSFLAALPLVGRLFGRADASPANPPTRSTVVRVWTMGNLDHKILPSELTLNRLTEILKGWDHVSDLDIVWDPTLRVEQYIVNGIVADARSYKVGEIKRGD